MSQRSRASKTRVATMRPSIGGQPRGRLEVDLTGLPDDMEACFIREHTLGQRDLSNVHDAMERGFVPASEAMFPAANPKPLPGDNDETHGLIRRGGQILMVRPKRMGDEERHYQRQEVEAQKRAASKLSEGSGDSDASFDGRNFQESEANQVVERTSAGQATRPKGDNGGSRFQDA